MIQSCQKRSDFVRGNGARCNWSREISNPRSAAGAQLLGRQQGACKHDLVCKLGKSAQLGSNTACTTAQVTAQQCRISRECVWYAVRRWALDGYPDAYNKLLVFVQRDKSAHGPKLEPHVGSTANRYDRVRDKHEQCSVNGFMSDVQNRKRKSSAMRVERFYRVCNREYIFWEMK